MALRASLHQQIVISAMVLFALSLCPTLFLYLEVDDVTRKCTFVIASRKCIWNRPTAEAKKVCEVSFTVNAETSGIIDYKEESLCPHTLVRTQLETLTPWQ